MRRGRDAWPVFKATDSQCILPLPLSGQYFYPSLIPRALTNVKLQYLSDSNDPLLSKIGSPEVAWFTTAVVIELLVQCPCFLIGAWGLCRNSAKVYPLLIAYASLGTFSTMLCLAQALGGPSTDALTNANRVAIAQAYGPFTAIPVALLVDMAARCNALISVAVPGTKEKMI